MRTVELARNSSSNHLYIRHMSNETYVHMSNETYVHMSNETYVHKTYVSVKLVLFTIIIDIASYLLFAKLLFILIISSLSRM